MEASGNETGETLAGPCSGPETARWLLKLVRESVEAHARKRSLPDSVTAIAGDVLVKLLGSGLLERAPNDFYILAATGTAIREICADTARRLTRKKRTPGGHRTPLEELVLAQQSAGRDVVALRDALTVLQTRHPRAATIVDLRFFGGMTMQEIATDLGVSLSTVESDWNKARAWLLRELTEHPVAGRNET